MIKIHDILIGLLKRYFEIRMILKRTIVTERRGRITINIYDDLAPNIWTLYEQGTINQNTGLGKLDLKIADLVQEGERQRIAKQVFDITKVIILEQSAKSQRDVKKEWNELYGDTEPKGTENHITLINYSLGALFYMQVLTPSEYDIMEPAFDESGHLLYMRNFPKPHTDEVTEALGHLISKEEEKK